MYVDGISQSTALFLYFPLFFHTPYFVLIVYIYISITNNNNILFKLQIITGF